MIENIRNTAVGLGVMILLPLLVHVGIRLVIKEPSYPRMESSKYQSKENEILREQYRLDKKEFDKHYFYIAAGVGIAVIISGVVIHLPFLAMGLILGGVFCLVSGYFRYWDELKDLAIQAEAIKNIKIDKITVWDSGSEGSSSTANFLSNMGAC